MSILKTLVPVVIVPAPVASTAWVGYEVMQGDEKVETDIDELKKKNTELNGELDKVNEAFKSMSTSLSKTKIEIEDFEKSIKEVEKLKATIKSHIDTKLDNFKQEIKSTVEEKFKAIKFGDNS